MKKIISLDLTDNSFRELQITKVVNYGANEVIEVWYDDCFSPMYLNLYQYTNLTMGRITELHPDEINLLLVRE